MLLFTSAAQRESAMWSCILLFMTLRAKEVNVLNNKSLKH